MVGQHRSTQRLDPPPISDDERQLREFLRAFSTERPRWGWRRAAKAARKAGWQVNDKRIRRLWREEGLRVPQKRRKQPLRGIGAPVGAMCPIRPDALWALDFQFDVTVDGRTLKLLNIIDEFTREALVVRRGIGEVGQGGPPPVDFLDDLLRRFDPHEGFGVVVPVRDPHVDGFG